MLPRSLCHRSQERVEKLNQAQWAFSCLWKKFLPGMKATAMAGARRCLSDDCISCCSRCPRQTADNYTFCFLFHVWQPAAFLICSVHLCTCILIYNLGFITLTESQISYLSILTNIEVIYTLDHQMKGSLLALIFPCSFTKHVLSCDTKIIRLLCGFHWTKGWSCSWFPK